MMDNLQEKTIRSGCGKINAPEDLVCEFLKASEAVQQDEKLAREFATVQKSILDRRNSLQRFDGLPVTQGRLLEGLAVLSLFPVMEERHRKLGVDEKITQATQKDLLVWMEVEKQKTGHWGLAETDWLRNHISGNLFRLGRLQFESAVWVGINAGEVCNGTPVLKVHITADGKMGEDKCRQSLDAAPDFFRRHLPDFQFKALTCESWLLDPALGELLPESSNIIRFQKMWTIYPSEENGKQACERVFGQYPVDPETAPQKNHLQRQMLLRVRQGRPIRSGIGVIYVNRSASEKDAVR